MASSISASLRRAVEERARNCCEYCLIHGDDVPTVHEVDHLVARKHGGSNTRENLALACLPCNRRKGSDLTAIDPISGAIVPLYNPRSQSWDDHFRLEAAVIVGQTPVGRATVLLLRLNDPVRVDNRRRLIAVGRYPGRR